MPTGAGDCRKSSSQQTSVRFAFQIYSTLAQGSKRFATVGKDCRKLGAKQLHLAHRSPMGRHCRRIEIEESQQAFGCAHDPDARRNTDPTRRNDRRQHPHPIAATRAAIVVQIETERTCKIGWSGKKFRHRHMPAAPFDHALDTDERFGCTQQYCSSDAYRTCDDIHAPMDAVNAIDVEAAAALEHRAIAASRSAPRMARWIVRQIRLGFDDSCSQQLSVAILANQDRTDHILRDADRIAHEPLGIERKTIELSIAGGAQHGEDSIVRLGNGNLRLVHRSIVL